MSRWAEEWARKSVGIFSFFRLSPPPQTSADKAKERLQVLLALERSSCSAPSFLPQLQEDIMKVIAKYVHIENDKVLIEVERGPDVSMLDINIEIPATPPEPKKRTKPPTRRLTRTAAATT